MSDDHYGEVHGILFRPARATSIDFKGNVVNWITLCRMEGGGIPMFRTGFAKRPFKSDKTNYVLGVCWLGSDLVQSCYDGETQVLTEDGWKVFTELTVLDKVATLNENGEIEYQFPSNIVAFPYKGIMYHVQSSQIDLKVTPEHKLYFRKRDAPKFRLIDAKEVFGIRGEYKKNGKWFGNERDVFVVPSQELRDTHKRPYASGEKQIDMDVFLEFFGYYIAEGDAHQNKVSIGQSINNVKNRRKTEYCLDSLPFSYSADSNRFYIYSRQLVLYLKQFGLSCNKYIPKDLKTLSSRQLKILLNALLLGDGYEEKCYFTTSRLLADDVQEIAIKVGFSSNITVDNVRKSSFGKNPLFKVHITRNRDTPIVNHGNRKHNTHFQEQWEPYNGFVYCCEVPNHIILVRRNGMSVWSGNSWFSNVPDDDFRHMQENHDDYVYVLKKYGKTKTAEEAIKAEVVI